MSTGVDACVTRKRTITDKISVQEGVPGCSQPRGSQPGMKAAGAALCYGLMLEGRVNWCNTTAKMLRNHSFKLFKHLQNMGHGELQNYTASVSVQSIFQSFTRGIPTKRWDY